MRNWQDHELESGETLVGTLIRGPEPGAAHGRFAFVEAADDGRTLRLPAAAKLGHSVLERELTRFRPGDQLEITYQGKRLSASGERVYRDYEVRRCR